MSKKELELRTSDQFYNEFFTNFEHVAYSHQYSEVFVDFLDLFICAFSLGEYEEDYFRIIKKYTKQNLEEHFPKMIACLINYTEIFALQGEPSDLLGNVYQDISSKYKQSGLGQFFTPIEVCKMMGMLLLQDSKIGYMGNDPACGSGRLPVTGFMKNRHSFWLGQDLDYVCARMSIVNFYLHGMVNSEVWHMDTLALKAYHGWRVCIVEKEFNNSTVYMPVIRKILPEEWSPTHTGNSIYFDRLFSYCNSGQYKLDYEDSIGVTKLRNLFQMLLENETPEPEISIPNNEIPEPLIEKVTEVINTPQEIEQVVKDEITNNLEKEPITLFQIPKSKKDKAYQEIGQTSLFDI